MLDAYARNTLEYSPSLCGGCGMCVAVCPHGVFTLRDVAVLSHRERCMECGACVMNCPTGAIAVESGVGCASALMWAALTGRSEADACCGPRDERLRACCGRAVENGEDRCGAEDSKMAASCGTKSKRQRGGGCCP